MTRFTTAPARVSQIVLMKSGPAFCRTAAGDFLRCDGRLYDTTVGCYQLLYRSIGVNYGGATTSGKQFFAVPHMAAPGPDSAWYICYRAAPQPVDREPAAHGRASLGSRVDAHAAPRRGPLASLGVRLKLSPFAVMFGMRERLVELRRRWQPQFQRLQRLLDPGWAQPRVAGGPARAGLVFADDSRRGPQSRPADSGRIETAPHDPAAGEIVLMASGAVPLGMLPCDGRSLSVAAYPALYAAIGNQHGTGSSPQTFNIPLMTPTLKAVSGGVNPVYCIVT